ncbi:hypothetical protein BJF90_34635 [Pseudonocardia sp. CNS-004]|nr:hypothetical protein BJF90_34635 [Pseudonocardia sp. CNS-004]
MTRLLLRIVPVAIVLQLAVAIMLPTGAEAREYRGDAAAYVVHARTTDDAAAAAADVGVRPTRTYGHAFAGFAAELNRVQVDRLRARQGCWEWRRTAGSSRSTPTADPT